MQKNTIKSFVFTRARGLNRQKIEALTTNMSEKTLSFEQIAQFVQNKTQMGFEKIIFEIGAGYGHTALHYAKNNPTTLYIACEVYVKGLANIYQKLCEEKLNNLYLCSTDAIEILHGLAKLNLQLNGLFILYPDPWPKAKHNKRRIFSEKNLPLFASVLHPNCPLLFATDHNDYKTWAMQTIISHISSPAPLFSWAATSQEYFNNPPSWWVSTKFEQKAIKEGRSAMYINLTKK